MAALSIYDRARAFVRSYALHQLAVAAERAGVAGGPMVGLLTSVKRRQQETHPLVGANVNTVQDAMLASFRGNPSRLQDLYDDMLDRDPRVAAVVGTRILVIQSRPWSISPPKGYENDPGAKRRAEIVSGLVDQIRSGEGGGWRTVVGQIADGIPRGYSVNELDWAVSGDGYHYPKHVHWRHPNRFGWDNALRFCFRESPSRVSGTPLVELGRDKFVTHAPMAGRAAYPMRRGVMLGMVFPSLTKRYGVRWWLKATERWGSPMVIGELPEGKQDLKDEAKEMLRRLYSDFVGVIWGGIKVTPVTGSGTLRPEVYSQLTDAANVEIAIRGLGQNLTTEVQGGSYAAANVSNLIRLDLLAGDLAELDGTIQSQIIEPIHRYNWPGAPVSRYETEVDQRAEITLADVQAQVFDEDEYRGSKGYPARVEEDGSEAGGPKAAFDVQALQGIVTAVALGELPRDAAASMIELGFQLSAAEAQAVLGSAGTDSFKPTTSPITGGDPAAPEAGGAADSPFPRTGSRATSRPTSARSMSPRASELYRRLVG